MRRARAATRGLIAGFLLISAGAFAAYELLPSGQLLWWTVLALTSVAAVAVGIVRYRPRPALPWLLVGAALLVEAIGDVVYQALGGSVGGAGPFPTVADAIYVTVYPIATVALLGFVLRDTSEYRRGTLLDILIVAIGLGALSWSVFVIPSGRLGNQPGLDKTVLITYLLGDALLLALALQLPLAGRGRAAPVPLLLVGALGMLYGDEYFAVAELHPSWSVPGEIIGYAAFYIAWGLAALLPSMAQLVRPLSGRPWALVAPRTWVAVLCSAALVSPVLLLITAYRAAPTDTLVLAGCCVVLFLLVFARLLQALRAWQATTLQGETQAYLHTLIADAQDAVIVVSPKGRVGFSSPSAKQLFGDRLGEGSVADLFSEPDQALVARCFDQLGDPQAAPDWPSAVRVQTGDGRIVRAEARWSDLRADPTVRGIVLTLRDVTEERRLEEELRRQALTDPLTGLMNRQGLRLLMHEDLDAGTGRMGAAGLLMVDLDDFKEINDTLGHPIGDEVLVAVAGRLTENVREEDAVARFGGDEFAVLMAHGPERAGLEAVAQRVLDAFDEPVESNAGPLRVTASVGLAVLGETAGSGGGGHGPEEDGDPDALMRAADLALYAAKAEGKARWRRYHAELLDQAVRRAELRSALDDALAHGSLDVFYQPIVHLNTRRIAGFEALARWPHPTLGLLSPDSFIPLAEETGQIRELGNQMLRLAVKQAVAWNVPRTGEGCFIGINVSVHQLRGEGFVEAVRDVLAETGIDPRHVVLEVTETALLDHEDVGVRERLRDLRALGVAIALDDFGTGYASLISLHDMPIDIIKIDKSFTSRLTTSDRMRRLVRGLLTISDTLEIRTIAEGIEGWDQHRRLLELGVRAGQGYLYSRPVTAGDASALWAEQRPLPLTD
ncbi:diguanylate cyclase (GGDEF)-like protein/PAS domain S-box-containing protein [Catenulispora sp. GP43]|uniref:putative bifunctional diguanylate cyclase/phosphodiesterase n=1 Tax=Catenulispora sp. GP43 TaxID=3156263 RepID=UPI003517AAEC